MIKFILFMGLLAPSFAATYEPVSHEYSYQNQPEFEAIVAEIKSYGTFVEPEKPKVPEPKTMSRGQRAVEEAKARNRAILAEKYKEDKARPEQKDDLTAWKAEVKASQDGWKKEVADTLAEWKREQEIFLGRIKIYKENTFEIPAKKEKIVEKKIPVERVPEMHIVNGAFTVPVRDQKDRATCSAFAGLRAVEIILAQNKSEKDLSEQYFYWSSKPNCQDKPCTQKGSWVTPGFRHSELQSGFDVPLESACGYNTADQEQNETQVPLSSACHEGAVKVMGYDEVLTLADAVEKLKKDVPVIMGAKLSENFYRNKGLVKLVENQTGVKLDAHSKGHSFLAVGVMELPEKLRNDEGTYCIVVANSWGQGWGSGGYACLTEKWLTKFRQPSPFIAVRKVSTRYGSLVKIAFTK